MIKEILILTYILIVLVISSLVRAEVLFPPISAHGTVQQATLDPQNGVLDVRGQINSACESKPVILVKGIDRARNEVLLDVIEIAGRQVCDDKGVLNFDIVYDLKEIPLDVNQVYTIAFASSSQRLTYKALEALEGFDLYKTTRQSFTGTLISTKPLNGDDPPSSSGFVLQNGDQAVRVLSPGMDLAKFSGENVTMMGYPVDTASLNGNDSLAVSSGQVETIIVPVEVDRVEPIMSAK
jgi:hypothetical protein